MVNLVLLFLIGPAGRHFGTGFTMLINDVATRLPPGSTIPTGSIVRLNKA